MFSKDTYQRRREVLKNKMQEGIMIFLGNVENPMNFAANPYPFRQDSSFLYYFGIQEPKLAAAIDLEEDKTIIYGDELNIDELIWMGSQETIKAKAARAGVQQTQPYQNLFDLVKKAKQNGRKVHFLPPYQPHNKILLSQLFEENSDALEPSVDFI